MEKSYYKSPIGVLEIICEKDALISLKLVKKADKSSNETILIKEIRRQLSEYFSGERKVFDIKINPQGTKFQKLVWKELQKIQYGKTKSYSEIAAAIGNKNAQRAIGSACNRNHILIVIPCHRVISKNGNLGGFEYGINIKEKLLNLENITKDECKSFTPSIDNNSKVLILGSMPGVKSLEEQQYYAHPQNRFWKVMASICNEPRLHEFDYDLKLKTLLNNNIALWDTIKSCTREGSLDSDIQNETPNDIKSLLKKYPNIKTICLNGNKSYSAFKKYFPNLLEKYNCFKMPSTSPANARYSLDKLKEEWRMHIKRL